MTARRNKAQLHLAPERHQNPYADYKTGMQDLFSQAMDRALGVQKASLAAVVKMQSDVVKMQSEVIEMQRHTFEGEPVLGDVFETASEAATQAYATCLEIQLSWLDMMATFAKQGCEMWFQLATMGGTLAGTPASQPQPELEEEEESIAYGVGAA